MPSQHHDTRIVIAPAEDGQYLAVLYMRGGIMIAQAYGDSRETARSRLVEIVPARCEAKIQEYEQIIERIREVGKKVWAHPRFPIYRKVAKNPQNKRRVGKHMRKHLASSAKSRRDTP